MRESRAEKPIRFEVTADGLESLGPRIRRALGLRPLALVAGRRAFRLAGGPALRSMASSGFDPDVILVSEGERYKSLRAAQQLWDRLLRSGMDRSSAIVALGGGGVCDLAGFVASTLFRGVPIIQAPTTLLAQVDAGIGGKTGINYGPGKNLIGTFWLPALSIMDVRTLRTLPERQIRSGLAEIIKAAFLEGGAFWRRLGGCIDGIVRRDEDILRWTVKKCCNIKTRVVTLDQKETEALKLKGGSAAEPGRLALNLGHTLGHALEIASTPRRISHGEAVALGMRFAATISWELGICDRGVVTQLEEMLDRARLPKRFPRIEWPAVAKVIEADKKRRGGPEGVILWVLPEKIGRVKLFPMPVRDLYSRWLKAVFENGGEG